MRPAVASFSASLPLRWTSNRSNGWSRRSTQPRDARRMADDTSSWSRSLVTIATSMNFSARVLRSSHAPPAVDDAASIPTVSIPSACAVASTALPAQHAIMTTWPRDAKPRATVTITRCDAVHSETVV